MYYISHITYVNTYIIYPLEYSKSIGKWDILDDSWVAKDWNFTVFTL